jgi:hypothetical protein
VERLEDDGIAVMPLYPEGRRSFDVPREAQPGDLFEVSFAHDRRETEWMAAENRRLMDELLERNE